MTNEQARRVIGSMFVQWGGFAPTASPVGNGQAAVLPPRMQAAFDKLRGELGPTEFASANAQRLPKVVRSTRQSTLAEPLREPDTKAAMPFQESTIEDSLTVGAYAAKSLSANDASAEGEPSTEETHRAALERRAELLRRIEVERRAEEERKTTSDAWANFKYPTDSASTTPVPAPDPTPAPSDIVSPQPEPVMVSISEKARRLASRRAALQSGTAAPTDDTAKPKNPPSIQPKDTLLAISKHARRQAEADKKGVVTRMRDFFGV